MKPKLSPQEMKLMRQFHMMEMRDEINRLTYLENIPKEPGKRQRTPEEDMIFWELGRAYHGRREVFGFLAEEAAREGNVAFFELAAKYLAKIKAKESDKDVFTRHAMWALVFVFNAFVRDEPEPTKRELIDLVRDQLKSRNITPMGASDEGWQKVWRASHFLRKLKQVRTGSVKYGAK